MCLLVYHHLLPILYNISSMGAVYTCTLSTSNNDIYLYRVLRLLLRCLQHSYLKSLVRLYWDVIWKLDWPGRSTSWVAHSHNSKSVLACRPYFLSTCAFSLGLFQCPYGTGDISQGKQPMRSPQKMQCHLWSGLGSHTLSLLPVLRFTWFSLGGDYGKGEQ